MIGKRRQTFRGYTLLELVLVLAILGVALAAVAPSLRGFGTGRLTSEAAIRFLALTRFARSQAISDGCPYRITIDVANGTCTVQMQEIDSFVDVEGRSFKAAEGVRLETTAPLDEGVHCIEFDPTGRSGPADVVFVGSRGQVTVTCDLPTDEYRISTDDEVRS